MALSSGTKLGPYEVQSLLGAGGMGEVYRARDTRLQRDVAIKILPASLAEDQDRLRRFEQEARAVAALNHPNLLTVFDVGTASVAQGAESGVAAGGVAASPFLVSELLEGASLRERLVSGPLPQRKALDYAVQIARGLAAAHERGIVHRDIKPDNIFVTNDGRVKILDFGLAKLTEVVYTDADATLHSATQAGVVLGTAGYMSPEQVRGKAADSRSDIFSFGAVLYEMLSGRRAFHGESAADVMSSILNKEPGELIASHQEISPALDHIVHHCLEKDVVQRFQSAGDLAFQLSELSGTRSSTAMRAIADADSSNAGWRERFDARTIAAIAAVAIALLLPATWFVARSTVRLQPPTFTQLTFQQGYVESARFLPDGQSVIMASRWGTDRTLALYTASINSQGARPLGVSADEIASVSPSGELLAIQNYKTIGPGYVRVGTLGRLPMGGGAPRPVLDSVQYADWAPDGKDFAVVRFIPDRHVYRLEYPAGKVLYETAGWISHPRFSRDGKRIAFLDHPIFGDDQGVVAVVDLEGHHKQLSSSYSSTQGLAWSPTGEEVWFSAVKEGVYRSLYATSLRGHERPLLSAPGNVDVQDVLPNGRVLLDDLSSRRVLMVFTPDHPDGRDFTWMDWVYGARFSSDGKQILFGDQHSGAGYGTFLRNLDGSAPVRLGDGDPFDLSADGKWAISRMVNSPNQILLLPTGTGDPRQLTHSSVNHTEARWLADGRIFCVGNERNHPERTYLIDINGNETAFTPEGVRALAATSDGKRLLTFNEQSVQFQLYPLDGGAPQPVSQLQAGDRPADFTPDDKALLVHRAGHDGAVEIWRVDLADARRTLLRTFSLPPMSYSLGVTVSRDAQSYAYQAHPSVSTEYVVDGLR